jgi:hypothetical protein
VPPFGGPLVSPKAHYLSASLAAAAVVIDAAGGAPETARSGVAPVVSGSR